MLKINISIITASAILFSGCAVSENIGKISGTGIGAGLGATLGKKFGGDGGMLIGAALGGTIGYLIGDEIDARRNSIKEIVKNNKETEVAFNDIKNEDGKIVGQTYILTSEKAQFDSGKDKLNPYAVKMFEEIAKQYAQSGMSVMIVGHTDADGSDKYNQQLSERRAKAIATLFQQNGVALDKIYYKGAGENEPIAQNDSDKGKAKNRRVEVVEAPNEDMIVQYAANKKINNSLLPKNNNQYLSANLPKSRSESGNTSGTTTTGTESGNSSELGANDNGLELPLNMTGTKVPEPLIAGSNKKKFNNQDLNGNKELTGVSGKYYTIQKKSEEKIGSCNNEYAYSKNSYLDINNGENISSKNQLLSYVGYAEQESVFELVKSAVADEDMLAYYGTCLNDSPRVKGNVKKLSTGEVILAKQNYDLAPLLNGSGWGTQVDNEFIMINPVGIKRANMQSVSCPEINVIKSGSNQPWYGSTTEIVSYNGKEGLLYRVYPEDTSKVQCIDMAYPHGNPQDAKGVIYYKDKDGNILAKKVNFFSIENSGGSI